MEELHKQEKPDKPCTVLDQQFQINISMIRTQNFTISDDVRK